MLGGAKAMSLKLPFRTQEKALRQGIWTRFFSLFSRQKRKARVWGSRQCIASAISMAAGSRWKASPSRGPDLWFACPVPEAMACGYGMRDEHRGKDLSRR